MSVQLQRWDPCWFCGQTSLQDECPGSTAWLQAVQSNSPTVAADLSAAPPGASSGDTVLELAGGKSLRAHAVHLSQVSDVLTGALEDCVRPETPRKQLGGTKRKVDALLADHQRDAVVHRLPLLYVSIDQAVLLLHCIYAFARESWAATLAASQFMQLAQVSSQLACTSILDLVDSTLVKQCISQQAAGESQGLTVRTAPAELSLASRYRLREYEAYVGRFIGRHASEINMSSVDSCVAHVLQGALEAHAEDLARMI